MSLVLGLVAKERAGVRLCHTVQSSTFVGAARENTNEARHPIILSDRCMPVCP